MPILGINAAGGRGFWQLPDVLRAAIADRLPAGWELALCDDPVELGPLVRTCRAVVGWPFPAQLARRAPDLRWVHFFTSGVPESWRDPGTLHVTTSAAEIADSVAEHGLFLVLAALRGVRADSFLRWEPDTLAPARAPRELTAVLFGHGEVGARLARLLAPIFGAVRSLSRTARGDVLPFTRAADVLPGAGVVVLALPLSDESRALFRPERFFDLLPAEVSIVNLSRGQLLDEAPLLAFLAANPRSRYLADVAHPEPYPDDGPLRRSPQVLLTPHVGARREDAWRRIGERVLSLMGDVLPGARMTVANDLERHLGDPAGDGPCSWRAALLADEDEAFPAAAAAHLVAWGYPRWLVPQALGGELRGLDELLELGRVVARRDLTLAIAVGQSLLGALPVWIAGDPGQKQRLAAGLERGALGCLALTEEAHGSDLAASELAARREPGGWILDGTKWCVNNATRGETMTVLARTDAAGGPRGFSVFLVEKDRARGIAPLARLRTHGIRGADISGAVFTGAGVGEALVGREGHGLDVVMKTLQVSRTLCAAFSLGAADTALRLALDFALERRLYGATAWDIPAVRRALLDAIVDLGAAETVARACARALSFLPEQMSVLSAVGKVIVPELCGRAIDACRTVLGARAYLREGPAAPFQKLVRDHAVVPLFDGSTPVNLYVISGQLERLAGARAIAGDLRGLFGDDPAPPFDPAALRTSNRGADHVLGSIGDLGSELARTVAALRDRAADEARALAGAGERQDSHDRLAAAHRYAELVAAAICLHAGAGAAAVHRLLGMPAIDPPVIDTNELDIRRGRAISTVR